MTAVTERTREEWAASTVPYRRKARFTYLIARARKDVALESLPLTAEQWIQIAAVYTEAARSASVREEDALRGCPCGRGDRKACPQHGESVA